MKNQKRESFGQAQFEIQCEPHEVKLIIHGNIVVARTNNDVYEKLFDYCQKIIEQV
jgi:hypothetical protein